MKYSFPAFENGFIRAAAASPALRVADCAYNAAQIIGVMREYAEKNVQLLCLPEFALTGYTCSDLFLQETLLRGAEDGLAAILKASEGLNLVVLVGLPVRHNGKLYNCAAVLCNGELLGLVPKMHLPNYGEFYEKRHFIPGMREPECIELAGQETLIGTNLLFACKQMPAFVLAAEVCEDLWAPVPPSCAHALAGATVVANLSASDETVGKAAYRRELVCGQSARLLCAYLYADAGHGESTTDMTFAGHNLIAENGSLLADTAPFASEDAVTELDLGRMVQERQRNTTFMPETDGYITVEFELPPVEFALTRPVSCTPFVPQDAATRAERCELILRIQAEGLAKRMEHTHAKCGVLGISGGLDSCLALLVAVRACKVLGRAPKDIIALTMPCFGTTRRTRSNAEILCEALGVTFGEINPRAHAGTDGLCQQKRRLCHRHRRLERAGIGLGHLQRRPHEYVRRQCRRAENAGTAYRAVCGRHLWQRYTAGRAGGYPGHAGQPRVAAHRRRRHDCPADRKARWSV